jgi:hypothetical protein
MTRITLTALTVTALLFAAACSDKDVSLGDDSSSATCGVMNATGVGQCDAALGVKWDGQACVYVSGCSCTGADCDNLFQTYDDCQAGCHMPCDSLDTTMPCPDGQFCQAPNYGCGMGYCAPAPTQDCSIDPTGPVCGCDGVTYDTLCDAEKAGVAPDTFTACGQ